MEEEGWREETECPRYTPSINNVEEDWLGVPARFTTSWYLQCCACTSFA